MNASTWISRSVSRLRTPAAAKDTAATATAAPKRL